MAKQDDWVRLQLRLPADVHEGLVRIAGAMSLNALIVAILSAAAKPDDGTQLTLRLPPSLRRRLVEVSGFSMNKEIVRRLEESFEDEFYKSLMRPAARITLDTNGRPISWEEINSHVALIAEAFPHPISSVSIEVMTPEIVAAHKRRDDAFNAEFPGIAGPRSTED